MHHLSDWDWEVGSKEIADLDSWKNRFNWVEEPYASPDGEKVAAVVNIDEGEFNVCCNDQVWDATFDKIWHLRFTPKAQAAAIVSEMGEWTMAVDGEAWENKFGYIWNPVMGADGQNIAVAVQQDMAYGMAVNGTAWETTFANLTNMAFSPNGDKTAAVVQVKSFGEGEIYKFQEGAFTAALDGKPWDEVFVNVWNLAISPDGHKVAAEVRLNLYDYTIAVDGKAWDEIYGCVWQPIFHPRRQTVLAPVRKAGKWFLAEDGQIIWDKGFMQLWHQQVGADGNHIAAIVAPKFGKWTVAVDGTPWSHLFSDMVSDLTFAPDGQTVAAVAKEGTEFKIVVNDQVWGNAFDMAWQPIFSPNSKVAAAKVEVNGQYTIAINDNLWAHRCEAVWEPVFSPQGDKIMIPAVEHGKYYRHVVPVNDII